MLKVKKNSECLRDIGKDLSLLGGPAYVDEELIYFPAKEKSKGESFIREESS